MNMCNGKKKLYSRRLLLVFTASLRKAVFFSFFVFDLGLLAGQISQEEDVKNDNNAFCISLCLKRRHFVSYFSNKGSGLKAGLMRGDGLQMLDMV